MQCTSTSPDRVYLMAFDTRLRSSWLTSAGFGYTVDLSIGYGYVRNADGVSAEWVRAGRYELEVATERVPADVYLRPLYDPTNERIRS